ncbi:MAG: S41 family peptidase [Firmicutes bacterium]|nr:S41 family peptidase [Bacillota bacterium]
MKTFKKLLIIFLLTIIFPSISSSAIHAQALSSDTEKINKVIALLKHEYIEDVSYNKLINGALGGMKKYLEKKKLDSSFLPAQIPDAENVDRQLNFLDQHYKDVLARYPAINKSEFLYETLKSLVATVNDKYTIFMDPKEFDSFQKAIDPKDFGGIGIYIAEDEKNNKQLTVVEPIEDTPAFKAGLKPGDMIMYIEKKSTKGMNGDAAQSLLRGKIGTKVTLLIKRKGESKLLTFTLKRALIHIKSTSFKMLDGKIGYIEVKAFARNTATEVEYAMRKLETQGVKAYILDLRNNGGGYVDVAVDLCSKFLNPGSLVVTVVERKIHRVDYNSGPNSHLHLPVVVLVNDSTASASEITAGAFQDLGIATVVGTKTFGKASVQQVIPFSDDTALKVTIAIYLTPNGRDINHKGLEPDINVPMDPTVVMGSHDDTQLTKSIEILKKKLASISGKATPSGENETFQDAVKVNSVDEEYQYIKKLQCDADGSQYQVVRQSLITKNGKFYDAFYLKCTRCGKEKTVIFDINEFFGK